MVGRKVGVDVCVGNGVGDGSSAVGVKVRDGSGISVSVGCSVGVIIGAGLIQGIHPEKEAGTRFG